MDLHRLVAAIQRDRLELSIGTTDLVFLCHVVARAEAEGEASLPLERLYELYEQVCDFVEPGAQLPRKRATHTLEKLRTQRLLARVDGQGLLRAGDFAVTSLAEAIVGFFRDDEVLTRESLETLTKSLIGHAAQILHAARESQDAAAWRSKVALPLGLQVSDIVKGIERRQRGMDRQQEEVRGEIARLLHDDWFQAIERCEQLLDGTATTLSELNTVLMTDAGNLLGILREIEGLAERAAVGEALLAVAQVLDNVERVRAWGDERHREWSSFFMQVQQFIRNVVRLDPGRALHQRMADVIRSYADAPWSFVISAEQSLTVLRDVPPLQDTVPVVRPHRPWDGDEDIEHREGVPDIEGAVDRALAAGAASLSDVLRQVLPALDAEDRYGAIGRIAEAVARQAQVRDGIDPPWVPVPGAFLIEDWTVAPKERSHG